MRVYVNSRGNVGASIGCLGLLALVFCVVVGVVALTVAR